MIIILIIVALAVLFQVLLAAGAVKTSMDDEKAFRKPFEEYQAKATAEQITPAEDNRYEYVLRVAEEWRNLKMTSRAILVRAHDGGAVIHQVNANGAFSKKGPYFISLKSSNQNWIPIGTFHLVRTLRGKNGNGWKPDHKYQDGVVGEVGIRIVEPDTSKRPPLDFRAFVARYPHLKEKKTEPNQALQTMTTADTSAAAHPPRQL